MNPKSSSIDCAILKAFYLASGRSISGEELAEKLKISRTAVWAHIAEFRELGYVFESQPNVGYRLVEAPDLLVGDDLMARGSFKTVGQEIVVFRQTASTNDLTAERAKQGAAEGLVIFAEKQTKGRGRMQRSWESKDHHGLWFSFLLRCPLPTRAASQLTIMTTLAVLRALHGATQLPLRIKWPNDIYCGGRKMAGILTEIEGDLDRIHHAVIGVGINVSHREDDFSPTIRSLATSLSIASGGQKFHRPELAVKILESIDRHYEQLKGGAFQNFLHDWEEWDDVLGKQISVRTGDRTLRGQATHLDDDGALVIRLDSGVSERITSGDLKIERIESSHA
jgi:BirA family transcriptional regulator, biotin operon repressor / biotin---[acetyl-CoA-carboxylase] ligase